MKSIRRNIPVDFILCFSILTVIAASVSISCIPLGYTKPSSQFESRAKATLRSLGETELAYGRSNNDREYGTWRGLIMNDFIAEGYTMGDVIEHYSLWTSISYWDPNHSRCIGMAQIEPLGAFTAVGFPTITEPPGYLHTFHTFAIREDQVLRVYNPKYPGINAWGENDDYGARTWEPVR